MWGPQSREEWIETAGLAVAAGALYASGFFALVFLLPLEALSRRRGFPSLLWGVAIAVLAIALIDVVRISRLTAGLGSSWLLVWNWSLPLGLLAALALADAPIPGVRRALYRLLLGWGAAMLVTLPLFLKVVTDGSLMAFLEGQFSALTGAASGSESARSAAETAVGIVAGTYGPGILIMLVLNWYLGSALAHRFSTGVAPPPSLARFAMPAEGVWAVIGGVGGIVLSLIVDLGAIQAIFWNIALISLMLYAAQGLAIGRHLLEYYQLSPGIRLMILLGVLVLLFVPGINLVVLLGLPGLGVSELWIDYNRFERSAKEDESHSE